MEYAPSVSSNALRIESIEEARAILSKDQENHLSKAHSLFGYNAISANSANVLFQEDLENALESVLDEKPSEEFLNNCIADFCKDSSCSMTLDEFSNLMASGRAQPKSVGRFWVALSLAEAETIRRILHVRSQMGLSGDNKKIAERTDACVALRYSPVSGAHVSSLTGSSAMTSSKDIVNVGGLVLDNSLLWESQLSADGSKLFPCIGATKYESLVAHSAFRFFDCDMHFVNRQLNVLVRELRGRVRERERFFNATIGCRRRMDRKVSRNRFITIENLTLSFSGRILLWQKCLKFQMRGCC